MVIFASLNTQHIKNKAFEVDIRLKQYNKNLTAFTKYRTMDFVQIYAILFENAFTASNATL